MRNRRLRRKERKTEVARKARNMAGLGPIVDEEIDMHIEAAGGYENAKIWAVKSHLERHYRYNQQQLNVLRILETKRAKKGDIIYVAVENERDIGDLYSRKAECKSDNTVIMNYIPPQFFESESTQ